MGIKKALLSKAIKKMERVPKLTSYSKAQFFGLLIPNIGSTEFADYLEQELRNDGKAVERIILHNEKEKESTQSKGNTAKKIDLYKSDFNLLNMPKTEQAKQWMHETYEYLIVCGDDSIPFQETVVALNCSKCKIGFAKKSKYLDIAIEENGNYAETILSTLKQIKNNG